jgi:hypothetical protein
MHRQDSVSTAQRAKEVKNGRQNKIGLSFHVSQYHLEGFDCVESKIARFSAFEPQFKFDDAFKLALHRGAPVAHQYQLSVLRLVTAHRTRSKQSLRDVTA